MVQGKTASLSRGLNSSHRRIDDVRHRRFGIWRNAADVDLAKNIAIFVTSLALDLTAGYAFAKADELPARDASFVGIGLSFRRDTVDGSNWHPH